MKKILLIILVLIGLFANTQSLPTVPSFTNINQKYQWQGMLPPLDTTRSKWGWARIDGVPYWGDGVMWHKAIQMQLTAPLPGQSIILGADSSTLINFPLAPGSESSFSGTPTVIDLGNLNYFVNTNGPYLINGQPYPTSAGVVTLPVGSAGIDSGRVDLIVVTAAGVGSVQGTNSDDPQAPVPDPQTTLPITSVLILEDDTTPAVASTNSLIWNENVGPAAEATYGTTGVTTTNPNAATAGQAFNGTKYITINAMANNSRINFIFDTARSKAAYTYIVGRIKLNSAWAATTTYSVRLINGATLSNAVSLITWGIIRTTTGTYQTFAVPLTEFNGSLMFTGVVIQRTTVAGTTNWQLDYLQLQASGVSVTSSPSVNIYNSDGTLNSDRLVNGAGFPINFYNVAKLSFTVPATADSAFKISAIGTGAELFRVNAINGVTYINELDIAASRFHANAGSLVMRDGYPLVFFNNTYDIQGFQNSVRLQKSYRFLGDSTVFEITADTLQAIGKDQTTIKMLRIRPQNITTNAKEDKFIVYADGRIWSALYPDGSGYDADSVLVVKNGVISVASGAGGGSALFPTSGTGTAVGAVTADMAANGLNILSDGAATGANPTTLLNLGSSSLLSGWSLADASQYTVQEFNSTGSTFTLSSGKIFKVNRGAQFGDFTGSASDATVSVTSTGTTARSLFVGPQNMSVGAGGAKVLLYVVDSSIVTGNVSDLWGKGFQFTRKSEFGTGGAGALSFIFGQDNSWNLEISDTLSLQALNGDGIAALVTSLGFTKNAAYTGRTAVKSGSNLYDVSSAVLATINLSGGSTTNNFILNGDYSGVTSYLLSDNANHTDTIQRYYGFLVTGAATALTPYVSKFYQFSGNAAGTTRIDSMWFLDGRNTLTTVRQNNVLQGYLLVDPTKQKTASTEALEVYGSIKMVDGNQSNGYVLTSDANGKASWQAAGGGGASLSAANTWTNTNEFDKNVTIGQGSYVAGMPTQLTLNYDGSGSYGVKGIVMSDLYNGGSVAMQLIGGTNTLYITTTGGSPGTLSFGSFVNPNDASTFNPGSGSWSFSAGLVTVPGTTGNTFKWNATSGTPSNTVTAVGWIKVNVAGTDSWLPYYQ